MSHKILKASLTLSLLSAVFYIAPLVYSQYNAPDKEIDDLNVKIQNQKKELESIQAKQRAYQAQINLKKQDKLNLSNQLSIIEDKLEQTKLDIDGVNLEMNKLSLEIQKIEIDVSNIDKNIENRKEHIGNLLKSMYKQDQVSSLEMLLLNNSLSEFLNQVKYLEDTNKEVGNSVEELKNEKTKLDDNKASLDQKNQELLSLKKQLEDKKDDLSYEQKNKNNLLDETQSSEQEYQKLLQTAKREQQQAESDIANAEQLIRQKMSEKEKNRLNSGNNTISWPVPVNTIVTKFHDPDYPYRKIIGEHSGVDMRAKQGTAISAAADGYVAKVKFDGSNKYSYIMLIHGNGLATVYGHVSAAYVVTDQYVSKGQVIGRTGGMPGGVGSGPFTTGPHLHFEVRLNGLPVDPQQYLQ